MALSVNNQIKNTEYNFNSNLKTQKRVVSPVVTTKIDKSNDGKFSCSEAGWNFFRGLVSPVVNMFSSPKNFLVGAGMMAGSTILMAATGGAVAPIFVALGIGAGAVQTVKAGVKIAKAKSGDDVEKAFYDMGGATSTIGLSVAGAKSSLKQANIKTDNLSSFGYVKKCFVSLKDLFKESFGVFKSGYYKTNLRTTFEVVKNPQNLRKCSEELSVDGEKYFEESFGALKDILPDEVKGSLKGRSKCQVSIFEKMVRHREELKSQLNAVKNNTKLSAEEKATAIKTLQEQIKKFDTDKNVTKSVIGDAYGARISDLTPSSTKKIVSALQKAAKEGKIEILEVENYRGKKLNCSTENKFYLDEVQLKKLANSSKNVNVSSKAKESGYTAIQLKVKPKNGKVLELQLRGKEVDKVADWEHIPYDLRQGKDIAKGSNINGANLAKVQKAVSKLTKEQDVQYKQYIYDNYMYAQAKELGKKVKAPKLPEGIDKALSSENLMEICSKNSNTNPKLIRNPFDARPQSIIVAASENIIDDEMGA